MTCSIAIATHNRLEELQRTLVELRRLDPAPDEVLICADACSDGTEAFVREKHPECKLIVNSQSKGSIGSRDLLFREAKGDLILSLDDDSHPVERDFLRQIKAMFNATPELAVATFPQLSEEFPESLNQTNFGSPSWVGTFTSSGAVIRRSTFLALGGYPTFFHHGYEEPDFALRCIASGYKVRLETSLHVRHRYSKIERNEIRTHHFHARNELWSVLMRCPAPQFLAVALFRWVRQFGYACKRGPRWMASEPVWWSKCLIGIGRCLDERKPIPWEQYRQWMDLVRHPQKAAPLVNPLPTQQESLP